MKKTLVFVLTALWINNSFALANVDTFELIDTLAKKEIENSGTPSLQISIGYQGEILYEQAYGFSDLENNVLATSQSKYRTASIAKWFTATAAMKLVESEHLDLDKPIQEYCPSMPSKKWTVSTRQLLTHTAGVRGYLDFDALLAESKDPKEIEALRLKSYQEALSQHTRYDDVTGPLSIFKDDPLLFEPDTEWSYTSFGYRILACVMEGASHRGFKQLIDDLVFQEAGMKSTVADDAWAIIPHRVSGYRLNRDGAVRRADSRDISENLPAGGYLSTASDLVRFALAFNDGLVSEETMKLMVSPVAVDEIDLNSAKNWRDAMPNKARYGYGGMLWSKYKHGRIGHTGRQAGAASILVLFPDKALSIAVITNAKGLNGYLNFAMKLADIIEESGDIASLNKSIQPTSNMSNN